MRLLDLIFRRRDSEERQIYCQKCGDEVTYSGGLLTSTGKVYCPDTRNEIPCYPFKKREGIRTKTFLAEELQEAIREGKLIYYDSLEGKIKTS